LFGRLRPAVWPKLVAGVGRGCLRRRLVGTSRDGCLRGCDGVMLSVWVGLFGVRCLLDWR
jgi:hypothetical protein